jgi:hypothetical protein
MARCRRSDAAPFDVKVLDFGIAKLADARTSGVASTFVGTPLYMAPEQMDADAAPTPAIDVWALGLIVYRALTGRYFWRSGRDGSTHVPALMREILFEPIPAASARAREDGVAELLPQGFDEWLAGCLSRVPTARFHDAGDACAALAAVLGATAERVSTATRKALRGEAPPEREAGPAAMAPTQPSPPSPSPPVVSLVHTDADFAVGRVADIIVIHWHTTPTPPSAQRLDVMLGRAFAGLGGKPGVIMPIVHSANPAPDGESRRALEATVARFDRSVARVAYVVLGSGFQSAALRAVITGLMIAARPSHTTKVFPTVAAAVDWVTAQSATDAAARPLPAALVAAVRAFCGE